MITDRAQDKGRKRGIVTDTLGLLLAVTVMAASVTENAAGMRLLSQAKDTHPQITHAWADSGFKNQAVEHAAAEGITLEIVPRRPGVQGSTLSSAAGSSSGPSAG